MMVMRIAANIVDLGVTAVVARIVQPASTVMAMAMSVAGVDPRNEAVVAFIAPVGSTSTNYLIRNLEVDMPFIKGIYFCVMACTLCTAVIELLNSATVYTPNTILTTLIKILFCGLLVRFLLVKLVVKKPIYNAWRE